MKKRIVVFFLALLSLTKLWAVAQFAAGANPMVDGVYNSTQVVIAGHQPMFSWEFTGSVSSFTIVVSSDPYTFYSSGEIWNYVGSTTTTNTINSITRIPYDYNDTGGLPLVAGQTYYWKVKIYDNGTTASDVGQFTTVSSTARLNAAKYDVCVDWNNPFNPNKGQITKFRFTAKDKDRKMRLRVYSASGELVQEWPEQTVLQDSWYTAEWDGKNINGVTVARGIYFVNLCDVDEGKGVTRRVVVIK